MKKTTLLLTTLLLTAAATAYADTNQQNETETTEIETGNTGWFTPDSILYGLEVAIDNARMNLGLATPAEITEKRTNEIYQMYGENNWNGVQNAIEAVNAPAERSQTEEDNQTLQEVETKIEDQILQKAHQAESSELQRNIVKTSKNLNNSHPDLEPKYIIQDLEPSEDQIITDEEGIPMADKVRSIEQLRHIEEELFPRSHQVPQHEESMEKLNDRLENVEVDDTSFRIEGENRTIGGGDGYIYGDIEQEIP